MHDQHSEHIVMTGEEKLAIKPGQSRHPSQPLHSQHEPDENSSTPVPAQKQFAHKAEFDFYNEAAISGELGSGPAEHDNSKADSFCSLITTFPYHILLFQLFWSTIVTLSDYALADDKSADTLDVAFWVSHLHVSSSVSYGVG